MEKIASGVFPWKTKAVERLEVNMCQGPWSHDPQSQVVNIERIIVALEVIGGRQRSDLNLPNATFQR